MSFGRWLVLLAALAACSDAPLAHEIWWSGDHSVSRFDPATGSLRAVRTAAPVRAVSPLADGGAWIAAGNALMRLNSELATVVSASVTLESEAVPLLASAGSGSVWVAQGPHVQRLDTSGSVVDSWLHGGSILAFAVAGPDAIFVADVSGITQYNTVGQSSRRAGVRNVPPSGILLDAEAGYLWMLVGDFAVQLDILAGLSEHARVELPAGTSAVAMESATGELWIVTAHTVTAIGRDGTQVASTPVPPGMLAEPSAVAADSLANRLWIGDLRGATMLNREVLHWIRLADGEPAFRMSGPIRTLVPSLTVGEPQGGLKVLRLLAGALCGGVACTTTSRYLGGLQLHASIGGADVTDRFAFDGAAGAAELRDVEAMSADGGRLRATMKDVYGNASDELVVDLSRFADEARSRLRPHANTPPSVAVTAPVNNAIFVAPASIAMAASASDSDGTVTKVEFFRDSVLLGADTTAPHAYAWTNVPVGTYKLTAKAYDNAGAVTTSAIVNVQVKANVAPTVALTAPANNAAYTAPATIAMTANASDSDGTIATVDFYQGGTKLGSDTTSPYAFTWNSVAGGTYALTAKAVDDKGAVTTSSVITVKVNKAPTVALSAPADNTTLNSPASVTITATAGDSDGSIAKVEFLRNGVLLGADTTSPYSYTWSNIPIGTYSLTAKATDNLGATTVSVARTLTVRANQSPTVALTAPATGTTIVAGAPVAITATAADADGTIAKVDFYADHSVSGSWLLGSASTSPFGITASLIEGAVTLAAVARDNNGSTTTSAPIVVNVVANQWPTVALTSPMPGQVFPSQSPPDITISATASDPDGSVVDVKFYYLPGSTYDNPEPVRVLLATVSTPPYKTVWHSVPLTGSCPYLVCPPDYYDVIAEATDNAGERNESTARITVPASSPWSIRLVAPTENAVLNAPATLVLVATVPVAPVTSDAVSKVEFLADGAVVGTVNGPPNGASGEYVAVWRNIGAGSRVLSARLYDSAGFVVDSEWMVPIHVRNPTQPPVASVLSPANESSGAPILGQWPDVTINAAASDIDGTLAQLSIIVDDGTLASSATSPISATWRSVHEGVHTIAAKAVDNSVGIGNSKPTFIRILATPRLQAVVLTSPPPGTVTNPVVLVADVGAPEGGVAQVRFYDGSTLLGSVSSPPYRLTASLANGSHTVNALAEMYNHLSMTSSPVTVTVSGANVPPTVSVTAPSAGQTFAVGATVSLSAAASDPDGTVTKVEFLANSLPVATAATSPYSVAWTPAAVGAYAITAKATDNQGATKTSTSVNVTAVANSPPQVSLTAPTSGQSYPAGVPFAITASASDSGGSVSKVEFYAGTTLIGTATSGPYTTSWAAPSAGSYALTAKATDNSNATTTSPVVNVTITANAVPTVTLSMPRTGQAFVTGGTINLIASATDADGGIAKVELFSGSTLLATVTAPPYAFAWSNVATGNYTLTAKVIDSRGATITSSPVTISVKPLALNVTWPAPGAGIPADFVRVAGTYTAPENSGITVNGIVATTDGQGTFFLNNFPLDTGINTLELTLTTLSGQAVTQSLTVTSTGDAPFVVVADPSDGFAPLRVSLRYSNRGAPPTSFAVSNLGSGAWDTSQLGPNELGVLTFANPGVYLPQVTLYYGGGSTYTQSVSIVVRNGAAMDQMFLGMLADFRLALANMNKSAAMQYLTSPLQGQFGPAFDALMPSMPQIVSTITGFGSVSVNEDIASYAAIREVGSKGQIYILEFLRDHDGVWRMDAM